MLEAQDDLLPSQKPVALQGGPLPFSQRYKKFGKSSVAGNKTNIIAETGGDEESEPDAIGGLNKVTLFGSNKSKAFAETGATYE